MLYMLPIIVGELDADKNRNVVGQIGFFDADSGFSFESEVKAPELEEIPKNELLAYEKEITGLYISGHPMEEYADVSYKLRCDSIADILENSEGFSAKYKDNSSVQIFGIISRVEKKVTKNNTTMCFLELEDIGASIECIVFSKLYADRINHLKAGNIVLIRGRLSLREDREPSVICESIEANPKNLYKSLSERKKSISIKNKEYSDEITKKIKILSELFPGTTSVFLKYNDSDIKPQEFKILLCNEISAELKYICSGENISIMEE